MIRRTGRCTELLIGALILSTYAWFYQGGFSNQNSRFDMALALALEHRAAIDTFAENTIDKVFVGGHFYLEKAPGATYLALPVPLAASLFWSSPDLLARPARGDLLLYLSTIASVSLLTAVAGVLFRRILFFVNDGLEERRATAITLVIFGGTLLLPYATMLFGHACAASWVTIGLYGLLRGGREDGSVRSLVLGWLALGAAVLTEYPAVVVALAVGAAGVLAARSPRRVARASPLFLVPLLGILAHNAMSFGSPWSLGYGELDDTMFGAGMNRGLFGIALPSPTVLLQLLFGTYRGLFVYSPVLVTTTICWAFWPVPLRRRIGLPLLSGAGALFVTISGYTYWQGGACFGPRHLVVAIPVLALGAAYLPDAWMRSPPVIATAALSVFVALIGTAITPFVAEEQLSPLTGPYPSLLSSGAMSIHPLAFLTPVAEGPMRYADVARYPFASFNLGERIGLRGPWSLAPLGLIWAGALAVLARRSEASPSRRTP